MSNEEFGMWNGYAPSSLNPKFRAPHFGFLNDGLAGRRDG